MMRATRRPVSLLLRLGAGLCLTALWSCDAPGAEDLGPTGPDRITFGNYKGDDLRGQGGLIDTALGSAQGPGTPLELVVTDVWGRLPDQLSVLKIRHVVSGREVTLEGYLQPVILNLSLPGQYELTAEVPDHHAERILFSVTPDGEVPVPADQLRHWSLSRDTRDLEGEQRTVHALYVGLEHVEFAASGPAPRKGSQVQMFRNGKAAFASMVSDLAQVRERAHFAYWLMRGDFELVRDADWRNVTPEQRMQNTILAWLDRLPGTRRVLLNQFWGNSPFTNETFILDQDLVRRAETPNDGVEVVFQGNETEVPYYENIELRDDEWSYRERLFDANPDFAWREFLHEEHIKPAIYDRKIHWTDLQIGSWHQKFAILDGQVAYLGGMNMNVADWDDDALDIYNPLRMPPDTPEKKRAKVEAGDQNPATAPRRDFMLRLEGRIADDIEAEFQRRWDLSMMNRDRHTERASNFHRQVPADQRGNVEGLEVQLTVTTPMPFWDHSILESMRRMIERAEDFIYIEDQYFRAPLLNERILKRMAEVPHLKLVVVTPPIDYFDPGRKWTAIAYQDFLSQFPDRVAFLQLKAHDQRVKSGKLRGLFVNVDVHSKVLLVDDRIISVGSSNKNNRGLIYEGEANLVIRDQHWVREQRLDIYEDLLGSAVPRSYLEDHDLAFDLLRGTALSNEAVESRWQEKKGKISPDLQNSPLYTPEGLIYPLDVPYRWWFDVGPDFS